MSRPPSAAAFRGSVRTAEAQGSALYASPFPFISANRWVSLEYIRQQPIYYHLPHFRLSPFNVESALSSSDGVQYRLFEKYPAKNWNSATMTLNVQYSRKMQVMGIFRFQSVDKLDDKVDVVVGLRRS